MVLKHFFGDIGVDINHDMTMGLDEETRNVLRELKEVSHEVNLGEEVQKMLETFLEDGVKVNAPQLERFCNVMEKASTGLGVEAADKLDKTMGKFTSAITNAADSFESGMKEHGVRAVGRLDGALNSAIQEAERAIDRQVREFTTESREWRTTATNVANGFFETIESLRASGNKLGGMWEGLPGFAERLQGVEDVFTNLSDRIFWNSVQFLYLLLVGSFMATKAPHDHDQCKASSFPLS